MRSFADAGVTLLDEVVCSFDVKWNLARLPLRTITHGFVGAGVTSSG
ncbi:MAG TPA: hypothetical protein VNJ08_08305 [Bacteriovoracaceae bacterium]|nr:hypothetical protein [Bacteriovoracaceae bacterium]